jgi:hypothetical protein
MSLAEDFRELRRVSTPWTCIVTPDYRATVYELLKVRLNGKEEPPSVLWTCVDGPQERSGNPMDLGTADDPPSMILKNALKLAENSILFWVVPDTFDVPNHSWSNPFTVQATANLRDAFKSNRRTLVILSIDGKLPPLIADDVPVLRDPLPTLVELTGIAKDITDSAEVKVKPADLSKAASLCLGMTRFSAEEAIARATRKKGIDLPQLSIAQREVIEQSSERGLMFERGSESFEDIGGLEQIKKFSKRLFSGERPPTVIVRIEEIEKAMAGTGSGGVGDTTGVSQDQLGVLLTAMEDNDWVGFLAVGIPGSGKSLISKAMGNTYKVPTVNMDLGALKGQYVGTSEGKVRKAMSILKSFAGNGAFFVATSNGLNTIPPELRRRFRYGIWCFDILTREEREAVWKINLKRFNLPIDSKRPDDTDYVGSDIRNICDLAFRLRCPLTEAAEYIVPVAKSDPGAVQRLRDSAHGKFLSASVAGVYRRPEQSERRAVSL